MRKTQREFLARLESVGLEIVSTHRLSRHLSVRVRAPDGRETTVLVPGSPSCWRAARNNAAAARRFMRGNAAETPRQTEGRA